MKKFEESDVFVNKVKTHPKVKLFGYTGNIYIDNTSEVFIKLNDFAIPKATIILTEEYGFLLITEDGDYIVVE